MKNSFDKIIDLIKQTGDSCIILDPAGNPQYVVLSFNRYQAMVKTPGSIGVAGLTEDQLLAKINADIATWKSSTDQQDYDSLEVLESAMSGVKKSTKPAEVDSENDVFSQKNSLSKAKKEETSGKTEEKYYFEPID